MWELKSDTGPPAAADAEAEAEGKVEDADGAA